MGAGLKSSDVGAKVPLLISHLSGPVLSFFQSQVKFLRQRYSLQSEMCTNHQTAYMRKRCTDCGCRSEPTSLAVQGRCWFVPCQLSGLGSAEPRLEEAFEPASERSKELRAEELRAETQTGRGCPLIIYSRGRIDVESAWLPVLCGTCAWRREVRANNRLDAQPT